VSPWPPAAQIETSDLFLPVVLRCFAVVAMMRPPVAAKGWPAARLDPRGLSLSRSMLPRAASSPAFSTQNFSDSQAAMCDRTVEAKASWISNRSEEHTSELQSRFELVCRLLLEQTNT